MPSIDNPARKHRVRHLIAGRDGWSCFWCSAALGCTQCSEGDGQPATFDHVYPKSLGGTSRQRNLVLACRPCNESKADRADVDEIMQVIRRRGLCG